MKIAFVLVLLASGSMLCAQSVKKGDPFTDATPLKFQGALDTTLAIPEFRGQHVILDFFSSDCIACFKVMPKIHSLQQQYGDSVRFLLVGKQDGNIEKIYKKIKKKAGLELAVAFDTVLFKKLKIPSVPMYIWIKPDGTVFSVTSKADVTKENVDRFLSGKRTRDSIEMSYYST